MLKIRYKMGFVRISEMIESKYSVTRMEKSDIHVHLDLLLSTKQIEDYQFSKDEFVLIIPNYIIDLTKTEEELFRKIKKNTRKEINRAEKRDNFTYIALDKPTTNQINEFVNFYNTYAIAKNLKKCNKDRILAYRNEGALFLSYIINDHNEILCTHLNIMAPTQIYCLYSALNLSFKNDPKMNQLIGRANKYLEWKNIVYSKQRGFHWYNFGGQVLYKQGENVNRYKKKFQPITGYDLRRYKAKSMLGKFILFYLYLRWKNKKEYKFTKELLSPIVNGEEENALLNESIDY